MNDVTFYMGGKGKEGERKERKRKEKERMNQSIKRTEERFWMDGAGHGSGSASASVNGQMITRRKVP